MDHCAALQGQLEGTAGWLSPPQYPERTQDYSTWTFTDAVGWTSGFFAGCLWYMYELTGEADWMTLAETWTLGLEAEKDNAAGHDIYFKIFDSFGHGFRLTGNTAWRDVVLEAAQTLSTRYNATVGCVKSSDWGTWTFPVNIDGLMSLELLFWGAANGGQTEWYDMAVSQVQVTINEHVREDGSTCRIVDFNPDTGEIIEKTTWGGYSADSTWSRGQAYAIYGFTMAHRETDDASFLDAARRVADYFIDNLPEDHVPYWDFDAPGIPDTERDSTAGSIAASALLELSARVTEASDAQRYYAAAEDILTSLCTPDGFGGYLAEDDRGFPNSPGILRQGCSSHADSVGGTGICDDSLIVGDYYFVEAIVRYHTLPAP